MTGWAHPWAFGFAAALPAYLWLRARQQRRIAAPYPPLQLRRRRSRRWLARARLPVEALLALTTIAALAGPYTAREVEVVEDEGIDLLLVLDVSLSMLAEDFPPNRLAALRGLARNVVVRRANDRIGLVVFAKDTYVHTPLTTDRTSLLGLLESVTVHTLDQAKSGGTAIGDALLVGSDRLDRAHIEGRDQALVLITDGESNEGIDPVLAARYAAERGIRLYAVGVGGTSPIEVFFEGKRVGGDESPYQAVLDDRQLRAIAAAAGGRYERAASHGALEAVLTELSLLERAPLEVRTVERREPATPWLAAVALLLWVSHLTLDGVVARRPLR